MDRSRCSYFGEDDFCLIKDAPCEVDKVCPAASPWRPIEELMEGRPNDALIFYSKSFHVVKGKWFKGTYWKIGGDKYRKDRISAYYTHFATINPPDLSGDGTGRK